MVELTTPSNLGPFVLLSASNNEIWYAYCAAILSGPIY